MHTTTNTTTEGGFRRQVCFRIGPEEWPLLEIVARTHGGIQAGLLAALRAYAASRLQPEVPAAKAELPSERVPAPKRPLREPAAAAPRKSRQRVASTPASARASQREPDDELVELNLAEAAPIFGIRPATLREQIKSGRRRGRQGANGRWLAQLPPSELKRSGLTLSPGGAGEVLAVKAATIKRRCKAGAYPNARHGGEGWQIPVTDLL